MVIRTVGPSSDFPSIAAAMLSSGPGDTIQLESGYSNETATIRFSGMTIFGGIGSQGIVLNLAPGIATVTMTGNSPFQLNDAADSNGIVGNAGDNRITVTGGVDAVDGGLGQDRLVVDYRAATGAVTGDSTSNFSEAGGGGRVVTVTSGTIENFTILTGSGADTITTGSGNDYINTAGGASTVSAGQGRNTIIGGGNSDTVTALDGGNLVRAGNGANTVTTGGGADRIYVGKGTDTVVAGGGADRIFLTGGADSVDAGAGLDRLIINYSAMTTAVTGGVTSGNMTSGYVGLIADLAGSHVDFQRAESFDITTGLGDDTVTTGAGADILRGGLGADLLRSGSAADMLFGGGGNDVLRGGLGTDLASGGAGADVFVFGTAEEARSGSGRDRILDFLASTDRIDVSGIDADTANLGNQGFSYIGSAQFSAVAGQLRFGNGVVSGDVDGDGRADFEIEIGNQVGLTQGDFIL